MGIAKSQAETMTCDLKRRPNVLLSTAQERQILDWCHELVEQGQWLKEEECFSRFFEERRDPSKPRPLKQSGPGSRCG